MNGISRFLSEHKRDYAKALRRIYGAKNRINWMWWIFPHIAGLDHSGKSKYYAIKSLDEARAYLQHDYLGPCLMDLGHSLVASLRQDHVSDVIEMFATYQVRWTDADSQGAGSRFWDKTDIAKLHSCMTLFEAVSKESNLKHKEYLSGSMYDEYNNVFSAVLDDLFGGERCEQTTKWVLENTKISAKLTTGFFDFDNLTGGLTPGELTIVASRPDMGKTALALAIAINVARTGREGPRQPMHIPSATSVPTLFFSLELSKEQMFERLLSSMAMVDLKKLSAGRPTDEDYAKMMKMSKSLSHTPLWINDDTNLSVSGIRDRCRKIKAEHGLGLVVIDYLQLIPEEKEPEFYNEEFDGPLPSLLDIPSELKSLALDLDVSVIVLSQLSSLVEKRQDKRPILADLGYSGNLEANADTVAFLYRDEYYYPDTKHPRQAELIVAKHRADCTDLVQLAWDQRYLKFTNKR